ncbi:MAG TPA: conjugal transfer protein [Symbiobacteriaceae bacterium]|nr:conjugal transfer protein [Symbiobacteriaceae bacterium]
MTTLKPRLWGAARWVIWILAGFVMLRGLISLLPDSQAAAGPAPPPVAAEPPADPRIAGFAAFFAREYLTFTPADPAERAARLAPFLAPGIDRTGGLDSSGAAHAQSVVGLWPWHLEDRGPGRWTVTVIAQVQDGAEAGKAAPPPRYLALSVPVSAWKGGFAVSAYPAFVPVPLDKPDAEMGAPDPGEVVSETDAEVRDLLLGFLKAYTGGTPAEIRYYLLPGVELPGLGGQFAFRDLLSFQLRKDGERYWAAAVALLRDSASGADYRQHLLLELSKGERWYIKDIAQKGGAGQ